MKNMKKSLVYVCLISILTIITAYSALAVEGNILNAFWENGGNALTVTQGENPEINLEILSGGNEVALRVELQNAQHEYLAYLVDNFTVYHSGLWEDNLVIETAALAPGDYNLRVTVLNWNGVTDEETLYLHVDDDNRAPSFKVLPKPRFSDFGDYLEYTVGEAIEITVDGYDADGDSLKFTLATRDSRYILPSGLHFALEGEDKTILTGSIAKEGSYTIDITVTDGKASYTAPLLLIISADTNHAPTYTIFPEPNPSTYGPYFEFDVDEIVLVQIDGQDEDYDELTFYLENELPAGLSTRVQNRPNDEGNDLWISGRPQTPGTYTVLVAVTDGKSEYKYPLTFVISEGVVEEDNTAPIMNNLVDQDMNEGEIINLQAAATDADGDQLTYQAEVERSLFWIFRAYSSNLLDEMTFNPATGEFTFAPGFDFVDYPDPEREVKLRFRAFDGEKYSGWETVKITVNDVIIPPEGIAGCMDPAADNYNPEATIPGTCVYPPEDNQEICYNGLDDDHDQLVDCADPDCASYASCQEEPAEESLYENVKIKSVQLSSEELQAGDYLALNVYLFNNGDEELEDLRVIATVYDLNVRVSGSEFDLEDDDSISKNIYFQIPEDALPGEYLVKITVMNSQLHEYAYRMFIIW